MVQATTTPATNGAVATKGKDADITAAGDATNGGTVVTAAGASAGAADGTTPAAALENGSKPAPAADGATPAPATATEATAEAKEAGEQRRKEDEIASKGAEIAGVRALLSRAFNKPSEEPARPKSHWTYLLEELAWLAVDFSQERLWRRTAAFAIAYEIATKKGEFGLKQPPKEFRTYSDEIRELRAAAAKGGEGGSTPPAEGKSSGRRSARKGSDAGGSIGPTLASFLQLDPENDPVFAEFEIAAAAAAEALKEKESGDGGIGKVPLIPGTPPTEEELASALAFPCDATFADELEKSLMASDVDRLIQEEIVYRSYRLEYEASVVSHQLAVQEQLKQANTIFDLGLGPGFGGEAEEPDAFGVAVAKKAGKRRKGGRSSGAGGFLGLDDYGEDGDEYGIGSKRNAAKAALVDDVYLRKKKPTRTPAYRDVDADYDMTQEGGSRYSTRRATGALARQARAQQERSTRRGGAGGRADAYQQQQAARARQHQGAPGMMVWTKGEDDLLLAVVHEFGVNWTLVSEVLSLSLGMQGIHRPPQQCRQRFRHLTMQEGHDYSEERAYAALAQQLSKQQARELLVGSLPVRDDALVRLLEALVQVGAAAANKRIMDDKRNEGIRTRRQEMHPSYMAIMTNVMQRSGGRHMNPLELCATVNNAYMEQQARQQAMMAQQAQQAAAIQAQQQHAAAAAQHGQQAPGASNAGGAQQPGGQQQQQQQPGAPQSGQPQQQQGLAQGTPAGPHPLGLPAGTPPQPGMPPGSKPVGPTPPSAQVTLQQLNAILQTNKLPNGQELDEKMRQAIEGKKAAFLAQIQQQQQRLAAQGGGATGGASSASVAAMQASQQQQLAAMQAAQAGGRPPMPPGMYGMPPGASGGPPMQLPPGVVQQLQQQQQGGAAASGAALPAGQQQQQQQQQLLAQQMMAQQQAAAAAAAQQAQQQK
ncbi:hypothetical protein Ndes2526A_g05258 [Nannochloris sp. 'desiccata']